MEYRQLKTLFYTKMVLSLLTKEAMQISLELEINPSEATVGETFSLTCTYDTPIIGVVFRTNGVSRCIVGIPPDGKCVSVSCPVLDYNCSFSAYTIIFPIEFNIDIYHNTTWVCEAYGGGSISNHVAVFVKVPIKDLTISPTSSVVSIVEGRTFNFTCTTDSGRPAAVIEWYINDDNITDQSTIYISQVGTKFVTSSILLLVGNDSDHRKMIYCEAWNIMNTQLKSENRILDISVPVTQLTFKPEGINDIITVISGRNSTFSCTTGLSRPAATILWYIGAINVTNDAIQRTPQQQDEKYISFSSLIYMPKREDNGTVVYCVAFNIGEEQRIESTNKTIHIGYLPDKVEEVRVMCCDTALDVTWRSESDRGNKQIFQVVVHNLQTDKAFNSDNVSDPGVGMIVQYVTQLSPATSHLIYIESTNIYGTVRSDAVRYCNTTGVATTTGREEPFSFSAGFGSGAALIVFINIIAIFVVLVIKRRSQKSERSKVYEQTKQGLSDTNIYNELDETHSGRRKTVQDYGNVAYEDISSTVDQTSTSANPRQK